MVGQIMEAYMDDMLVESLKSGTHTRDLQVFVWGEIRKIQWDLW